MSDKTFEEQLGEIAQKAEEYKEYIPIDQIPRQIRLQWVSEEFKEDGNHNTCLYILFQTEDNHKLRQKYTTLMVGELRMAIEAIGTKDTLKNDFFLYEQRSIGKKGSFPRLYPVPQESSRKTRQK